MSSRKETDDPWLAKVSRTADRGPRPLLHRISTRLLARVMSGPLPEGDRMTGQRPQLDRPGQLAQPGHLGEAEDGRQGPQKDQQQLPPPTRQSDGWQILSYMLGGMILYGGIGWLVSYLTGISILFPLGMILGIGLSVALIIFRFTRT
jgi:ATP synthase protein I